MWLYEILKYIIHIEYQIMKLCLRYFWWLGLINSGIAYCFVGIALTTFRSSWSRAYPVNVEADVYRDT